MSDDTRDTVPSPRAGVDPEIVDAVAADLEEMIAKIRNDAAGLTSSLAQIATLLRREAREAQ